jgi:hypothetical protein
MCAHLDVDGQALVALQDRLDDRRVLLAAGVPVFGLIGSGGAAGVGKQGTWLQPVTGAQDARRPAFAVQRQTRQ